MDYNYIITFLWLVLIAYWIISVRGIKKDIRPNMWGRIAALRIVVVILAIIIIQMAVSWGYSSSFFSGINKISAVIFINPPGVLIATIAGIILCASGIAFAIWARWHIGKNWSPQPSAKENHELVTSGPYAFVRHPIYTGILVALLGSALATGGFWIFILVVYICVFLYRIPVEEQIMMRLFPDTYPEYKKRTKAIIPFVL